MNRTVLHATIFVALAGCTTAPTTVTQAPQMRVFKIRVTESPFLVNPVSEQDADAILADASRALQQSDDPASVHCPVLLQRDGAVEKLPVSLPSVVQTSADFASLSTQLPGEGRVVRLVQGITWCGGQADGILGCSNIPGNILVVRRYDAPREPFLWDHEFGHNRGLDHVTNGKRLMYPYLTEASREVTDEECAAFDGPSPALMPGEAHLPRAATGTDLPPSENIREFVAGQYPHGFPTIAARRFSPADIDTVLPLLDDPAHKTEWANIVLTAGAAGGAAVTGRLTGFLLDPRNVPTDPSVDIALTAVPVALGYLANQAHDTAALEFLLQHSQVGAWSTVALRVPSVDGQIGFERELIAATLSGLSVSGTKEAIARLEQMQNSLRATGAPVAPGVPGAASDNADAAARQSQIIIQSIDQAKRAQEGIDHIR